jgi:hypothetical protein
MKRQRPRMFLPKIHPPKFARNGETCDAKVAYPRFSRSPIFGPFRADPKRDPERRAQAGWHVRAAGEPWQTHPLYKKFTVSRDVTGAPATARSKVNKRGSMLKRGLEIHREKFVVVAQSSGLRRTRRSVLLPRNLPPGSKHGCGKAFRSMLSMNPAGLATPCTALLRAGAHQYPAIVVVGLSGSNAGQLWRRALLTDSGHGDYARFAALSVYRWHPLSCAA